MSKLWNTLRSYLWWTHKRGSFHYDVMVTLILLFIFVSPRYLNFRDKPTRPSAHQTDVRVLPNGERSFIFVVDASAVNPADVEHSLMAVIEPIAGEVRIERYEAQQEKNKVQSYKVWVQK